VVAQDRVLPGTRVLSLVIIPFLLVAFVLLYFWPSADDTARLFAWRIVPDFTAMVLGSVYLGGAYFFLRAVRATQWHTVGGGFIPVGLFASLMGIATITHWDKFIHTNVAFWLWAALYFTTPFLVFVMWSLNRRQQSARTADDVLIPHGIALLIGLARHRGARDQCVPVPGTRGGDRYLAMDAHRTDRPGDGRDLRVGHRRPGRLHRQAVDQHADPPAGRRAHAGIDSDRRHPGPP
jgi:hypothetical protein